jgi:hypothetical protein
VRALVHSGLRFGVGLGRNVDPALTALLGWQPGWAGPTDLPAPRLDAIVISNGALGSAGEDGEWGEGAGVWASDGWGDEDGGGGGDVAGDEEEAGLNPERHVLTAVGDA